MDLFQFLKEKGVSLSVTSCTSTTDIVKLGHIEREIPKNEYINWAAILQEMVDRYQPLKIYLACPYSSGYMNVKRERFEAVTKKAAELMKSGHTVYSPIVSCHWMAIEHNLSTDWDYWKELDKTFIEWCDEVWVLCLDGWKESKGVTAEVEIAKELGRKIVYLDVDEVQKVKQGLQNFDNHYRITFAVPSLGQGVMATTGDITYSASHGAIRSAMDNAILAERRCRGL
ncbi:hypothetical protein LCGC14_0357100 [marine sediment metagenome]|uniref:DUF1937 domain-containing protein n=1 Tax=marine sediment metagenome TaxID=412755 RepID=A0A0F9VW98_9ZZZZ